MESTAAKLVYGLSVSLFRGLNMTRMMPTVQVARMRPDTNKSGRKKE